MPAQKASPPYRPTRQAGAFAALVALVSWGGLASEAIVAWRIATLEKRAPWLAALVFWRFFTNLTVLGVALLMTMTAWRAVRHRPWLPPRFYAAMLVYILVVSATYELLLRRLWSPRGIWFVRDAVMHDVVPSLMLLFWLTCAPKRPMCWLDPIKWLAYPAAYLAIVLSSGRVGLGYPYAFIDPERLGAGGTMRTVGGFAAAFGGLGLLVVAVGKALTRSAAGRRG